MTVKRYTLVHREHTPHLICDEGRYILSGEFVQADDYDREVANAAYWHEAYKVWMCSEIEARSGNSDCTLCPHLGRGDPLVDAVAKERDLLRDVLEAARMTVPAHDLPCYCPLCNAIAAYNAWTLTPENG